MSLHIFCWRRVAAWLELLSIPYNIMHIYAYMKSRFKGRRIPLAHRKCAIMPVTGIGGFFFRSNDPDALAAWYEKHLGIGSGDDGWQQAAGQTIFSPFPQSSDYFAAEKQWMLNLRVSGLDALLTELEEAGIAIVKDPDWENSEFGRFARIHDPEGNAIELWEPPPD